jgi:hypothetical protein
MKEFNQTTKKIFIGFVKKISLSKWQDLQGAKVEEIEVEVKVEVEVGQVDKKWRIEDCH